MKLEDYYIRYIHSNTIQFFSVLLFLTSLLLIYQFMMVIVFEWNQEELRFYLCRIRSLAISLCQSIV